MWDTSRTNFLLLPIYNIFYRQSPTTSMAITFGEKKLACPGSITSKIVLDCWGELTRTPLVDGRRQESDQELILLTGDCHSFLNDSFSPGLSALFNILLVGVCGLTRQLTLPDKTYFKNTNPSDFNRLSKSKNNKIL